MPRQGAVGNSHHDLSIAAANGVQSWPRKRQNLRLRNQLSPRQFGEGGETHQTATSSSCILSHLHPEAMVSCPT
jgi:hypothetical protein